VLELLVDTQMLDVAGLDIDGEPRYAFHNIIWLFAREQLTESPDAGLQLPALTRVLGGWLALAETAHRALYGGDFAVMRGTAPRWQPPAEVRDRVLNDPLRWLEAERPNLCAAIGQATDAGLHEQAWELALYLVTLFEGRSYFDDWQRTHERALEAVRKAGNRRGEAALLCSLGSLYVSRRRLAAAPSVLRPALDLFTEVGDDHGVAMVYRNIALLHDNQGEPESAARAYERALDGFRCVGDLIDQAYVLAQLAQLDLGKGQADAAVDRLNEALGICREVSNPRLEAQVMYRLGQALCQQRRYEQAEMIVTTVLDMVRRNRDALGESYALHTLGVIAGALGRSAESEQLMRAALEVKERILDTTGTAQVHLDLARLLADQGNTAKAVELAEHALQTFAERRMSIWEERARTLLKLLTSSAEPEPQR
jgi:tetratricopeptide (TPR) repeat protein